MIIDPIVVFSTAAAIILLGFAANQFFKRTGVPAFLFLIFAGVLLGPIFNIISSNLLIPLLATFAEFTLMMVLFYGGITINLKKLLKGGGRIMVEVMLYVFISIALIAAFGNYAFGWGWSQSLIFASIIGGETTAAVVVPLTQGLKLREPTRIFLVLESTLNSVFLVMLFITFVSLYQNGGASISAAVTAVLSNFSIGIVAGIALSIIWVLTLNYVKRQKYTYVLTLSFILLTYVASSVVGGSGLLAVLIFGIFLGNNGFIGGLLKRRITMRQLEHRLEDFYEEVSFLFETFFFVLLGLVFSITLNNLIFGLVAGGILTLILLAVRTFSVSISTFKSEIRKDRKIIISLCAMGTTPATLAFLALSDKIPLANSFLQLTTYIIIFTNIVASIGAYFYFRNSKARSPSTRVV